MLKLFQVSLVIQSFQVNEENYMNEIVIKDFGLCCQGPGFTITANKSVFKHQELQF